MNYSGFWRRIAAYLLDVVPITVVAAGFFYLFLGFDEIWRAYQNDPSLENRIRFLAERNQIRDLSFIIWMLYSILLEASPLQGTVGKFVCRIKVVDCAGTRLTLARSIGRNTSKLVSYLPLGLGFLWAALSKQNQAWHDKMAKTYVVVREI